MTGLLAQLLASPGGAQHLLTLLVYLARLKDREPYEATREVIHSALEAQQAEVMMKSVAEEIEEVALQRGRVETRAEDILKILAVRGIQVSSQVRQHILTCQDLATLDRWFVRAVHATTTAEVFDELPQ